MFRTPTLLHNAAVAPANGLVRDEPGEVEAHTGGVMLEVTVTGTPTFSLQPEQAMDSNFAAPFSIGPAITAAGLYEVSIQLEYFRARLVSVAGGSVSVRAIDTGDKQGVGGGFTPRVTGVLVRPSDATQYAIGDIIANSATANLVVPISFTVARVAGGSGRISGCRCVVSAASGTIVLPAFDLLLFRPEAGIPFAAAGYPADNAALSITAAAMIEKVAIMSFSATGWRNSAGGATATGTAVYQSVVLASGRPYAPFNLTSCGGQAILGVLQAQNTWNPGAVVNTLTFALDVDQD